MIKNKYYIGQEVFTVDEENGNKIRKCLIDSMYKNISGTITYELNIVNDDTCNITFARLEEDIVPAGNEENKQENSDISLEEAMKIVRRHNAAGMRDVMYTVHLDNRCSQCGREILYGRRCVGCNEVWCGGKS